MSSVARASAASALGVGRLHCRREFLHRRHEGGLLLAGRGGDALAVRLLLGAQLVEAGSCRPAVLVGSQQLVDELDGLATGPLGGADPLGVLTQETEVDHPPEGTGAADERRRRVLGLTAAAAVSVASTASSSATGTGRDQR